MGCTIFDEVKRTKKVKNGVVIIGSKPPCSIKRRGSFLLCSGCKKLLDHAGSCFVREVKSGVSVVRKKEQTHLVRSLSEPYRCDVPV